MSDHVAARVVPSSFSRSAAAIAVLITVARAVPVALVATSAGVKLISRRSLRMGSTVLSVSAILPVPIAPITAPTIVSIISSLNARSVRRASTTSARVTPVYVPLFLALILSRAPLRNATSSSMGRRSGMSASIALSSFLIARLTLRAVRLESTEYVS